MVLYYQIRVAGRLDRRWEMWFDGMTFTYTPRGDTLLSGPMADQAALHGLLVKIRDLGLTLIALHQVEQQAREDLVTTINFFCQARESVSFAAGQTIFTEGEPGDAMYVVIAGEVTITRAGAWIASLAPGEIVGELALIDTGLRSASAIARTDCTLAIVTEQHFNIMVQQTPHFARQVMQVLVERLRRAEQ